MPSLLTPDHLPWAYIEAMKRVRLGLVIGLVGVVLAAGWVNYRNAALGFQLRYPTGWKVSTAREGTKSEVWFRTPNPGAEFGVIVLPAMDLNAWVKRRKAEEILPDGSSRVENTADTRLGGRVAKRIVLFGFDRYIAEVAVVVGKRLYVIVYDFDNPNDPLFVTHRKQYQEMRTSLTFF